MAEHAKLSASGSKKWLACTPSARLEATLPNESSQYASEGTFGHALFEHRLLGYLGRKQAVDAEMSLPDADKYHTPALSDAVQDAVDRAIERIEYAHSVCNDPVILLEQRLDYSPWVPEGFGTGDLVIIGHNYVEVLDLKMGSGVHVTAFENSQFRLYMLGGYNQFIHLYDIETVRGTVLQPRLNNYSSEELCVNDLLAWAEEHVMPRAKLAWDGEGDFNPGEHCSSGFCRARATCAARAEANLAIAQQDFALTAPELLTDDQIALVLSKADSAIKWLNDVQSHALAQATSGHSYPGFKLVEGRSNRKYKDQDTVAATLQANGIPEALIYERSLLGITAMEKTLGKKKFAELLADHIDKPPGKPALVAVSDKREEISATAISDFSQPQEL
jgi:hypothetical protein